MERKVKYDYAFKIECIKLITEQRYSYESVSKLKGIHESIIRKWLKFYEAYGFDLSFIQILLCRRIERVKLR